MGFFSNAFESANRLAGVGNATTTVQTSGIAGGTSSIPAPGGSFFDSFGSAFGNTAGQVLGNVAQQQLASVNDDYGGGRPLPGITTTTGVGASIGLAVVAMLGVFLVFKLAK